MSALELLFASALFLMALGVCGQLAVTAVKSRTQGMERNSEFRRIITLFHLLERDVRACQNIYYPDRPDLYDMRRPGVDIRPLLLGGVNSDGDPEVCGWGLAGNELSRVIYRADFIPGSMPVPLPQTKVSHSRGVESFRFRFEPPGEHFGASLVYLEVRCIKPKDQVLATHLALRR